MKRYSIVRVEQQCPFTYEKQDKRAFLNRCLKSTFQCNDCYGDTKEQLVRKIAQGIIIASKKKQIYIANPKAFSKAVSKIIVEFLGVEECKK